MAEGADFTYKHAALSGSLKTNLILEELDAHNDIVRKWSIGIFSTAEQATAARQILADSLGRRELGPPLTEIDVEMLKASL